MPKGLRVGTEGPEGVFVGGVGPGLFQVGSTAVSVSAKLKLR